MMEGVDGRGGAFTKQFQLFTLGTNLDYLGWGEQI